MFGYAPARQNSQVRRAVVKPPCQMSVCPSGWGGLKIQWERRTGSDPVAQAALGLDARRRHHYSRLERGGKGRHAHALRDGRNGNKGK